MSTSTGGGAAAHWMGSASRPGAPAIMPSTSPRRARRMLVQRGAALVVIDSANISRHTTDFDPFTPSDGRPESHRGTPHCLGWPSEVQCPPCHRSPAYADWSSSQCGLSAPCPDGPFRPGGNRVADPVVDSHTVNATDESRLVLARHQRRAALSCGTLRRSRPSSSRQARFG